MTERPIILRGLELRHHLELFESDYEGPLTWHRVADWLTRALALASDHESEPLIAEFTVAARHRKHGLDYNDGLITDDDHAALFACFVSGDETLWIKPTLVVK